MFLSKQPYFCNDVFTLPDPDSHSDSDLVSKLHGYILLNQERSWAKVISLHACVCPRGGGTWSGPGGCLKFSGGCLKFSGGCLNFFFHFF